MRFIGVDLGWTSGFSGLCCLEWTGTELRLLALARLQPLEEILAWLDHWLLPVEIGMIAIDAPTVIANQTGTRLADRLTHKYFGRYHAGCYPANLGRPFAQRTVSFSQTLLAKGFEHAPVITPQQPGKYQIEVFPHPAMINLFQLDQILKYKKGKLAQRRQELIKLANYIEQILPQKEPPLTMSPLGFRLEEISGKVFKEIEDQLDSLICAYIGAYWWYWGSTKNLVLGDLESGYIIIPKKF